MKKAPVKVLLSSIFFILVVIQDGYDQLVPMSFEPVQQPASKVFENFPDI